MLIKIDEILFFICIFYGSRYINNNCICMDRSDSILWNFALSASER